MKCVYCTGPTHVTNSRAQKRSNQTWRRRECLKCQATFTTHELVELSGAVLVDRDGIHPFISDILFVDLLNALKGHSASFIAAREITTTVIGQLLRQRQMVYPAKEISRTAAAVLKRFDRQAYLRYLAEHPSLQ